MEEIKKKMLEFERNSWIVEKVNIDGQEHIIYLPKHQMMSSDLITDNGVKRITAEELKELLLNEVKQWIKKLILNKYKYLVVMTYATYIYKKPNVHTIPLSISPFMLCLYRRKPKFVP